MTKLVDAKLVCELCLLAPQIQFNHQGHCTGLFDLPVWQINSNEITVVPCSRTTIFKTDPSPGVSNGDNRGREGLDDRICHGYLVIFPFPVI